MTTFTLTMPCADVGSALEFVELLGDSDIAVAGWVGRYVYIPWNGDLAFPVMVAELAFSHGYAFDSETATAARTALSEVLDEVAS